MITVQWSQPINDSTRGHIFYRRFYCGDDSITRMYSSGDFILFTPPSSSTLYVAEILSAWKTASRNFVSLRIYAKPQDTECGRLSFHGEDEVLVLSKIVVITCEQLFQYEHIHDDWYYGTLLNTRCPQEQEPSGLMCTETMLPIDKDYFVFNGVDNELTLPRVTVMVVDFQSYCRHKAIVKRVGNIPGLLSSSLFAGMGGILARHPGAFLVFCRKAFHDNHLETLLSCEGLIIKASAIKGVPSLEKNDNQAISMKRGESEERDETWEPPPKRTFLAEDASPTDTGFLNYEEIMFDAPVDMSSGGNLLCKKRRGRPRKSPQGSKIITINLPVSDMIDDNHNAQSSILIPTCDFSFQSGNGYSDGCLSEDKKQPVSIPTADYLESCMLKSHLIQQSDDENCADKMTENRKEFFESLFTFMIGRNTPITRIPLLGFKKCK